MGIQKKTIPFFQNTLYALKLLFAVCPIRVICIIIYQILIYGEWIFYDVFFLKKIIEFVERNEGFEYISGWVLITGVIGAIVYLSKSYMEAYIIPQTDNLIEKRLYQKIYSKACNVELQCFEDEEFYNKYTMALDNTKERVLDVVNNLFDIFLGIISGSIAFAVIISIDKIACVFLIFPLIGSFFFGKKMNNIYYKRYVDSIKDIRRMQYTDRVMYQKEYAKDIRFSNLFSIITDKFKRSVIDTVRVMNKYGKKGTVFMSLKNIFSFSIPFEGIMFYAAFRTLVTKSMELSDMAIIYSTMAATSWILLGVFNTIIKVGDNAIKIGYMKSFMEYKEKIPENQDGIIPEKEIHSIEFRNVSFGYKKDCISLSNISFRINNNTCVAIVGQNGAGKSTIIKLLLRLYDPISGNIFVNGIDIKKYNLKEYRKLFSVTFQDCQVLSMSLKDNILMGNIVKNEKRLLQRVLTRVELDKKVKKMKKGLDSIITKEFETDGEVLSGGEKQKVVLARTLIRDSAVKVFDEPSAALDPISEYNMYQQIIKEKKEGITIFVSHRLSAAKAAECVFLVENGSIIEVGNHRELIQRKEKYYEIYKTQYKNYFALE